MLAQCVPKGVRAAVADPRAQATGLWPEEAAHVARAVPKRQREFAAGRRAARKALADLGQGSCPLMARPDRAPAWPAGFIGSISHCDDLCIALCAKADSFQSIGCDVEEIAPMSDAVAEAVTTPDERGWLAQQAVFGPLHLFSAKEAVYKALFPLTKTMIDFSDLEIRPAPAGQLSASLVQPSGRFDHGAIFLVQSLTVGTYVIHICMVP